MAQYTFKYACGHGTGIVNLFGKGSERQSKLAWYEQNRVCPDCYKKQSAEEDAAAEKVAVLKYRIGEVPYFSIVLHGQTLKNKEQIKELGFAWAYDDEEGLRGMLAMKAPPKAWQKTFAATSEAELMKNVETICAEIAPLGYTLKDSVHNIIDMGMLMHQWQKIAEKEAAKAADKPEYNGCFDFLKERHGADYASYERAGGKPWNGKVYGHKGSYNYYVDDKRYDMTDEQAAAITAYQNAMQAWRDKYK